MLQNIIKTFFTKIESLKIFLESYIDLITISIIFIILVSGYYKLLISVAIFRFFHYLKTIPSVQESLLIYKEDARIIQEHWDNDKDLIYINRFCYFLVIVGMSCIYYSLYIMKTVGTMENYMRVLIGEIEATELLPPEILNLYYFGFALLVSVLWIYLFAQAHIIFCRNTPTKAQAVAFCLFCLRVTTITSCVSLPLLELFSNSPAIEPTKIGNIYQRNVPWGRGYGYERARDIFTNDILKGSSIYNKDKLINIETGNFCPQKANNFIIENKIILAKELPLPDCVTLGIKKGWIV